MRVFPLLAVLLIAAAPAKPAPPAPTGPDRPLLAPSREVSVLYRLLAQGKPQAEIRISTRPGSPTGGTLRRIDLPDHSYLLVNLSTRAMIMVVPAEGTLLDLPWDPAMAEQFTLNSHMRFTRRGQATVSRIPCTVFEAQQGPQHGEVCVTDDGVMLRIEGVGPNGQRSAIEAVSLTYTPAPESDFLPPPDFQHVRPEDRG